MNASNLNSFADPSYTREVYSVEGTRVTLNARHGWQCTCTVDTQSLRCAHVEQAQVLRQMRGARKDDDTVEFELSEEELLALSQATAVAQISYQPKENFAEPHRVARRSPWASLAAAAAIAGVSSGLTYLAVDPGQPVIDSAAHNVSASLAIPAPTPLAPQDTPVKFSNPFDGAEVFEFPPGTSEAGAREAVAELLMKRARERLASAELRPRSGQTVNREILARRADHSGST